MAFFNAISNEELQYDGFYDGQNKTIPEGTELTCLVFDGFNGIEEGKGVQACYLNLVVTTPGEFYNQKYRYNAKIYDMDAAKRDLAMRNLQVVDAQAGLPMTTYGLELTNENIQTHWVGKAEMRVKFGLLVSEDDGREINFVRGFGYLREKMIPPVGQQKRQAPPAQQQVQQQQAPQYAPEEPENDIGF